MKKQLSTNDFKGVYDGLAINISKLGCMMLDLEKLNLDSSFYDGFTRMPKFEGLLYYAKDKEKFWIDGYVADKTPHMTLLYGLMSSAHNYKNYIENYLLKDWKMDEVEIDHFGYFESPYEDEPYYCIVAHIKVTPELLGGNQRMEFLPHINTFAGYKPHFTIAYIKKDEIAKDGFITDLNLLHAGTKLKVTGYNFGKR